MKGTEIRTLNQVIGKALLEVAEERHNERIAKMLEDTFENVINAIKVYKSTRYNKSNGYFADEAIMYFDHLLEKEHEEIWMEIEDTCDDDWYNAVNKFYRW